MSQKTIKRFLINAGHGSMTRLGLCVIDFSVTPPAILDLYAPFSVHDSAINLLQQGLSPDDVAVKIRDEYSSNDLTIEVELNEEFTKEEYC